MVPHNTKKTRRLHVLIIVVVLLAANVGIAHMLIKQIVFKTNASTEVKDATSAADPVGEIKTDASGSDTVTPIVNERPSITAYTVKSGDTISSIAEKFDISVNTIRWANDLDGKAVIHVGDTLTILPVTGIKYVVKKGDTLSGIALKYDADADDIIKYNALASASGIKIGATLIIPDAELVVPAAKKPVTTTSKAVVKKTPATTTAAPTTASEKITFAAPNTTTAVSKSSDDDEKKEEVSVKSTSDAYFINPIPGSIFTQGIHGYNGVDFGAPIGTPVKAAASGTVIIAKGGNTYNGGYGNYIVIEHSNGTQTLYAHLSKTETSVGDTVKQGEEIAKSGNTGKSTGPHLHFEVRGGTNPFANTKILTRF